MDSRIEALSPWQQVVYQLCWAAGVHKDERGKEAGRELDRMAKERPDEYEAAFKVWETIMFEVKRCIIIFGPPGCGKGTEADLLHHHTLYISTGLMLRRAGYDLSTAKLVSDEVVNKIVMDGIDAASVCDDILLDGYPRTVPQAEVLRDHLLTIGIPTIVIHFHVADQEVLVNRMLNRNQGRPDDVEPVIRERLKVYEQETYPALQVIEEAFGVHVVDASRDPLTVHKEVWKIMGF